MCAIEASNARQKEARLTTRGRAVALYHSAKHRADKEGLPFDLTKEWIEERLTKGVCELTGLPFVLDEKFVGRKWGPSLDKNVPALGYTKSNTRVVCWLYNAAKGTATDADVLRLAQAVVSRQGQA